MTIAELFARIGLKTDEAKAKSFQRTMTGVKTTMITATAAATGTALAIRKITSDAFAAATALKQFETETGASAQELQKWQAVAEQTNQSAQAVDSAVRAIAANQEKIKLGQGDISGYQLLGINPNDKTPFEILEEVRSATVGMTDAMKKNILQQMGIGSGLLQTISLSREEFDKLASNAWIISPGAIETLNQTKSAVDLAGRAIKYIKTQIAVGLSPQIKETTKRFQEFVKVNEKGIIEGFKKGYRFVELFLKAITNTATMINDLVVNTIGWEKTIKLAAAAFGIFNAVMMASPLGLITAGIILLVAVLDDLYVYSKGGKSLFGELMKKFPEVEKTILGIVNGISTAISVIKGVLTEGLSVSEIAEEWGALWGVVAGFTEFLKTAFKVAIDDITAPFEKLERIIQGIRDFASGEGFGKLAEELGPLINALYKGATGEGNFFKNALEGAKTGFSQSLVGGALQSRVENISESIKNNISNTMMNDIKIRIFGSEDSQATGDATAAALRRELNAASAQMSRNE